MLAYYDENLERQAEATGGRSHPWDRSTTNPEHKYYDFRSNPEIIPRVLEDFLPLASHGGIQAFYELLRDLNSAGSSLETNDCGCKQPKPSSGDEPASVGPKARKFSGRLMVLQRALDDNCDEERVTAFMNEVMWFLKRSDVGPSNACVGLHRMPTKFLVATAPGIGSCVTLHWWVWENSDEELMATFGAVVAALRQALEHASERLR